MSARAGQIDLSSCDREPIHIPGSIQPHGVLLVVKLQDLSIVQYAGNTRLFLGVAAERILHCTLADLLESPQLDTLVDQLRAPQPSTEPIILLGLTTRSGQLALSATFHVQGEQAIIEFEPAFSSRTASGDPLAQMKSMLAALQSADDIEDCCHTAAVQVRALIGFSRVMVYQFLHDGSGKVIAEDKEERLDSFLHLHYPASDIPQQARALYKRSWLRLIPDINYVPMPLQSAAAVSNSGGNPGGNSGGNGAPLDMSHCTLRSVSPLHLLYLRNMGVEASMSLSIMIGDELWGLIACHNDTVRHVAPDLRVACELFAQLFSLQLDARTERATAQRRHAHQHIHAALAKSLPLARDIATELVEGEVTLLDLIPAGGVAIWLGDRLHTLGQTPSRHAIGELIGWLNALGKPMVDTYALGTVFAPASAWADTASGLLAISLSRQPQDYVIWFRPERVRSVTWAGNPDKPVESGPHGQQLTPRKSFAAWQADVRHQSLPWNALDIESAHAFRIWLLETVLRQMADLARLEREAAFTRQGMLMAELDHRVKNTLANIQALVGHTKASANSLEDFVLGLVMRLRAMARAHDLLSATKRKGASVRKLVEDELAPFWSHSAQNHGNLHHDHNGSVIDGPDLLLSSSAAMPFTIVLHELISNAAKYGALSSAEGSIDITWGQASATGDLVLSWKERNGPPVTPPKRRGFGSVVIERSLRHELKGSGVLTFDVTGVRCMLSIPAKYIVPDQQGGAAGAGNEGRV
ncbi:MAG: GAF domain-containing protein [Massilia sp.]|nr:GAF domain-containing protein [Massilia sp.]